jgi:hypothetical protein
MLAGGSWKELESGGVEHKMSTVLVLAMTGWLPEPYDLRTIRFELPRSTG